MKTTIISTALMLTAMMGIQSCDHTNEIKSLTAYRTCIIECNKQGTANFDKFVKQYNECNDTWERAKDSCRLLTGYHDYTDGLGHHQRAYDSSICKSAIGMAHSNCKDATVEQYMESLRENEMCRIACESVFSKKPKQ